MGRFFAALLLGVMLTPAQGMERECAQPVFFSLMFPQLVPKVLINGQTEGVFEAEAIKL